jgi:hypothetical protein
VRRKEMPKDNRGKCKAQIVLRIKPCKPNYIKGDKFAEVNISTHFNTISIFIINNVIHAIIGGLICNYNILK